MITAREVLGLLEDIFLFEGKQYQLISIPSEMRTDELISAYELMGFTFVSQEGDHAKYRRGDKSFPIRVGGSKKTHNGMIMTYLRQSGVSRRELLTAIARLRWGNRAMKLGK
jgi:predicted RNA binding protein YcfA (HicA-like mRNA interferase family)